MKKTIVALAVMTGLAAPAVALAEARVYGNIHLSINKANSDAAGVYEITMLRCPVILQPLVSKVRKI